jgi:hypothetical protein
MQRIATQVTIPAARTVAAAALLASPARAVTGDELGRQRPTGPPRHWPNPSSTEGGRPWPPGPPHW